MRSWDTNIERGIYWGLRLLEKDEEIKGKSANAKVFILISDGQAWSGEVAKSLQLVQARGIPVHVVGVGTTAGGIIPDPKRDATQAAVRSIARSVVAARPSPRPAAGATSSSAASPIATIANAIIDLTRRRAGGQGVQETFNDRYREFLMGAAGLVVLGILFLRDQATLACSWRRASACSSSSRGCSDARLGPALEPVAELAGPGPRLCFVVSGRRCRPFPPARLGATIARLPFRSSGRLLGSRGS